MTWRFGRCTWVASTCSMFSSSCPTWVVSSNLGPLPPAFINQACLASNFKACHLPPIVSRWNRTTTTTFIRRISSTCNNGWRSGRHWKRCSHNFLILGHSNVCVRRYFSSTNFWTLKPICPRCYSAFGGILFGFVVNTVVQRFGAYNVQLWYRYHRRCHCHERLVEHVR